ncbi:MAG: hypothetical protein QXY40_05200 [Candidatus Methanomethylicia archaeon]
MLFGTYQIGKELHEFLRKIDLTLDIFERRKIMSEEEYRDLTNFFMEMNSSENYLNVSE